MFSFLWRGGLNKVLPHGKKGTNRCRNRILPTVPRLEELEDRTVPTLIGSEFHVNTTVAGDQLDSANASSSNGLSVAVWVDRSGGTDSDIRAQMYNTDHSKLGGEIIVANSSLNEFSPAVAMDDVGNWKVVWTETSGTNKNVIAARFSSTGTHQGSNITVANTSKNEYDPSVAVNSSGDFVVSYTLDFTSTDQNVTAKMFSNSGGLQKTIIVASSTTSDEIRSGVARSTGTTGVFAVVYQRGEDILLKRYSATGVLVGTHTIASGTTRQIRPSVAMDDFGGSVVAWQALVGGDWDIFARKVSSGGVLSSTFTVANTIGNETDPAVTLDLSNGDFAVAYQLGSSVFVQEMITNGTPNGSVILVASSVASNAAPAISINGSDVYFITYTAFNRPNDVGEGIFGRFGLLERVVGF